MRIISDSLKILRHIFVDMNRNQRNEKLQHRLKKKSQEVSIQFFEYRFFGTRKACLFPLLFHFFICRCRLFRLHHHRVVVNQAAFLALLPSYIIT